MAFIYKAGFSVIALSALFHTTILSEDTPTYKCASEKHYATIDFKEFKTYENYDKLEVKSLKSGNSRTLKRGDGWVCSSTTSRGELFPLFPQFKNQ